MFRFKRTGKNPVEQNASEGILIDCFVFCSDEVKRRLSDFLSDKTWRIIFFSFDDHTTEIERKKLPPSS